MLMQLHLQEPPNQVPRPLGQINYCLFECDVPDGQDSIEKFYALCRRELAKAKEHPWAEYEKDWRPLVVPEGSVFFHTCKYMPLLELR